MLLSYLTIANLSVAKYPHCHFDRGEKSLFHLRDISRLRAQYDKETSVIASVATQRVAIHTPQVVILKRKRSIQKVDSANNATLRHNAHLQKLLDTSFSAKHQYDKKRHRLPRKSCDLLAMTKNNTTPKQNPNKKDKQ